MYSLKNTQSNLWSLIHFTNKDGNLVSALPFETDEIYYLVRMTVKEAKAIINDDNDYDDEGYLKEDRQEVFEDKYADIDYMAENIENRDSDDD